MTTYCFASKGSGVVLTLVFLLIPCFCGAGQEMVIYAHGDNAPYVKQKGDGVAEGIVIDLLNATAEEMPCTLRYRLFPWKRAYYHSEKGEGAIVGISKTSKRQAIFDYSNVVYRHDISLVVKKGNEFQFNGVSDLAGKRVAVHRGSSYSDDYERALASGVFYVEATSSREERLRMLLADRVDVALIGGGHVGVALAVGNSVGLHGKKALFTVLPRPLVQDLNYLAVPRTMKATSFIQEFNRALAKVRASGEFNRIQARYIEEILNR